MLAPFKLWTDVAVTAARSLSEMGDEDEVIAEAEEVEQGDWGDKLLLA